MTAKLVPREGQYPLSPALRGQRILSLSTTAITINLNRPDCH